MNKILLLLVALSFVGRVNAEDDVKFKPQVTKAPLVGELSDDSKDTKLILEGYIHQAYVKTTNVQIAGDTRKGSFKSRDIGVTAVWNPSIYFDARAFVKYKELGDRYDSENPIVEYGFVNLHNHDPVIGTYGLRLGKVRAELGFNNGVSENPVYRDQDIAPQSVYRDTLKEFTNAGKGWQGYLYSDYFDTFNLKLEVASVTPTLVPKGDIHSGWFTSLMAGNFTKDAKADYYNINMSSKDLGLSIRHDHYKLYMPYESAPSDGFPSGDLGITVNLYGVHKYIGDFDILYEYLEDQLSGSRWKTITPVTDNAIAHNLIISYKPNGKLVVGAGYNKWCSAKSDCNGEKLGKIYQGQIPGHFFFFKDKNIFAKYSFTPNWIGKAEYHWQDGLRVFSQVDNPNLLQLPSRNEAFSMSLTYAF